MIFHDRSLHSTLMGKAAVTLEAISRELGSRIFRVFNKLIYANKGSFFIIIFRYVFVYGRHARSSNFKLE